ncbi:MAG TPA: M13 family metallopeptidase N-terminal domain-containing protein, partial [Pyrinomonadaceae bacterium]|nr:M13 family metallopeptidase N-terminal domain-containing protein [Pyrinomonadaceae bacterium]
MNKHNRRNALLALLLSVSLPLNIALGQTSTVAQTGRGINLKYMDTSAKPCVDFYQYAAGNWLANNPVPADRSAWGAGSELTEKNFEVLHQILEEAAKDTNAPKGSPKRKVGDFYRSGMDEARIEAEGAKPLAEEFARIEAIKDIPSLQDEIARLHRHNLAPAFAFFAYQDYKNSTRIISWLYQGGLGLPNRDYYTNEDEKSKEIRTQYVAHIARMLELLGDKPEQAASEAKTVMEMETRLAKASMTPVEERDPAATYHKMTLAELNTLTPGFSWNRYFKSLGLADPGDINVAQPEFYKEVGRMMTSVPTSDWKTYLRWQLINTQAGRLSSAFVNEDFNFYGKTLRGTKELRPRWKRILEATDQSLGEALGQLYVERAFSPKAKAKAQELVTNLKA